MTPALIQRIALTPGEPAGIGPDLCVQLAQQALPCELVCFADPDLLQQRAQQLKLPLQLHQFDPSKPATLQQPGHLLLHPLSLRRPAQCGQLDPLNSAYVVDCIAAATHACLQGICAAMVTAPVHKGIINDAGITFSGHTEFIAAITGGHPVMMLATEGLRVALATTHLPLNAVSAAITRASLTQVLEILVHDLRRFWDLKQPRILVCGLNPHAGENGHLGTEEITTIIPVLENLRAQSFDLQGPLPADTLFTPRNLAQADAVLAMYHDQGLPVLKHKGFGQAVNITLGLPIIRTSVDHGTALELAGRGTADGGSLHYALTTAMTMAANQL